MDLTPLQNIQSAWRKHLYFNHLLAKREKMSPAVYQAIKTEWCKISAEDKKQLIYDYIEGHGANMKTSWMEFLQEKFGVCACSMVGCSSHLAKNLT